MKGLGEGNAFRIEQAKGALNMMVAHIQTGNRRDAQKFFDEIMALGESDDFRPIRLHARTLFELKENTPFP